MACHFFEVLILFELWAGERLTLEKAVPRKRRPGRPFSVSAVPHGPGTDIWRSCRIIGALCRALCALLGGIGRFMPCGIGANYCRLRHIWWEKCGHGLTSRPMESATEGFLNELPPRSAAALLEVLCLCGTVLVSLQVGFPLGAFLLMVTLLTWLLKGVRKLVLCGWSMVLLLACLVSKVVMEVTGLVGLVEALSESD